MMQRDEQKRMWTKDIFIEKLFHHFKDMQKIYKEEIYLNINEIFCYFYNFIISILWRELEMNMKKI